MEAAHALADGAAKAAPPVSEAEYRLLQRCKRGDAFNMPVLGFARILCSRGLLTQKRGTNQFRTTPRRGDSSATRPGSHKSRSGRERGSQ